MIWPLFYHVFTKLRSTCGRFWLKERPNDVKVGSSRTHLRAQRVDADRLRGDGLLCGAQLLLEIGCLLLVVLRGEASEADLPTVAAVHDGSTPANWNPRQRGGVVAWREACAAGLAERDVQLRTWLRSA
jgi:hypothetical protein